MSHLFKLRFRLSSGLVTITAWEGTGFDIDCELRQGGKVIFARGDTWCAMPGCIDGIEAKELVTSCFTIKPGDTDPEYFASYTPDQLAWVTRNGEELDVLKQDRWCDPETGSVRGKL